MELSGPMRQLAIFPLGGLVLFPHTRQLLNIFEPRYVQMTADALAGDQSIGMVLPREPSSAGEPVPTFEVGCLGRIRSSKHLPDGRYRILLEGESRFRIRAEPTSGKLYRVVEAELLPEPSFDELPTAQRDELATLVPALESFLVDMAKLPPEDAAKLHARLRSLDPIQLTHVLAFGLDCTPLEKQALLEAPDPVARCRQLGCLIEFQRVEATLPQHPPTVN